LVRWTGNDPALIDLAKKSALALSCGHWFITFMTGGFPVNILNTVKAVSQIGRGIPGSSTISASRRACQPAPAGPLANTRDAGLTVEFVGSSLWLTIATRQPT
jgi:hypothetical protein